LGGESPGSIKTVPIGFSASRYDWRELQRWNMSANQLPPGSEVDFRVPGIWEQYRSQATVGLAVLLPQAVVISWLLFECSRRRVAEEEAGNRRREVVRLNRVVTANVLSSSIAHELNQPLGAILINTEAAQTLLKANPPDLT
jgi:C4-dicarboxylate-specific signal transduction histidine kinase